MSAYLSPRHFAPRYFAGRYFAAGEGATGASPNYDTLAIGAARAGVVRLTARGGVLRMTVRTNLSE